MPPIEIAEAQIKSNGPLTEAIIKRIVAAKDRLGLSYAALGKECELSGTFIYNLINKNMNVSTQHVPRIVAALERLETGDHQTEARGRRSRMSELTHSYHLRPDLQVTLQLPADLTEREAERLALFIRSLPTA